VFELAVIGSKIWASQARKQPSQAICGKPLSILSQVVSEKESACFEKGARMNSFAAVLPMPGFSSMYEAICEVFVLMDNAHKSRVCMCVTDLIFAG
jgi:hypothetical protein